MPIDIVMPRLSDTMEEGRVLKWYKREGDEVKKGEAIAEIETDKANMELEAFESGVVDKIIVKEDETVPVGEIIAYMRPMAAARTPQPAVEARAFERREAAPQPAAAAPAPPRAPAPPEVKPPGEEKIKASPLARRIAQERGVDLTKVAGTGPEGRITREDVLAYLRELEEAREVTERVAAAPPAPAEVRLPEAPETTGARIVELTKMQATIAKRMAHSKATVPHFYVTTETDMTAAQEFIADARAAVTEGPKIGITDLVLKASALALTRFPHVNASYVDGKIEFHDRVNLGLAVALPDGLMVPVIHDCDKKSLKQLTIEARQLVERVRAGHLTPADFVGGTFTVSNLGMFDVEDFAAIINPPESAILSVASVRPTPSVVDGTTAIRYKMKATLSCDHRVFYGVTAAQFLQEMKRLLENPLSLVL